MITKYSLLKKMPNRVLQGLGTCFPHYTELFDSIRLEVFINKDIDFKSIVRADWPVCEINKGDWDYPLVNICFIENVLKNIIWCIASHCRPIIKIGSADTVNLWENLFEQPFSIKAGSDKTVNCPYQSAPVYFPVFPKEKDIDVIGKIYRTFLIPKKEVQAYFDEECAELINGKRVLGVLCRGTDYIMTKPKGHPVQPRTEEIIELASQKMKELKLDYIYLATEEKGVEVFFKRSFPGRVLVNRRHYFDSYYDLYGKNANTKISEVHFDREQDSYFKSLEYFSSLNILSKCDSLIAGNCGGSRAALYLNGGKNYTYYHLFDRGVY